MSDTHVELALPVVGMTCASCHTRVDDVLKAIPGISDVAVEESTHRVRLSYDPSYATVKDVVRALEAIGFLVMNPELTLDIRGMREDCFLEPIDYVLKTLPGVEDVIVKPHTNTIRVRYVASALSPEAMQAAVRQAGYEAEEHQEIGQAGQPHQNRFPWGLRKHRTDR